MSHHRPRVTSKETEYFELEEGLAKSAIFLSFLLLFSMEVSKLSLCGSNALCFLLLLLLELVCLTFRNRQKRSSGSSKGKLALDWAPFYSCCNNWTTESIVFINICFWRLKSYSNYCILLHCCINLHVWYKS